MARPTRRARTQGTSDEFFRDMVANMRNGVLAIDQTGHLVLMNDEACRIFGLPPDRDYLGEPYGAVLRQHPDVVRVLGGAYEMAALPNRAELRLKPSGKVIGYTLSLIRDERDQAVGAALFFKDLTHVEQLEERERLRDRLAALGEMAATMAHEIKNPLAGIEVMAGLLRRQLTDKPDAQALVADIINEAKLANAIVQEMLEFVRPVRLQLDRASIAEALTTAVTMADGKAQRGGIHVDIRLADDLPKIQGDNHQLTQVFANLLINAYEALDGRGSVTLSARVVESNDDGALLPDGQHPIPTVIVEVADTGPGVSPEVTDKIFNPFFTTKPQGSGLGLAIVRKIVDAHEGRIDVRSAAHQGTCFRVTLPIEHTDAWVR
ncbi:MAG TPA: ATP-binding protein [Vicinamibacterales bacterium]|nr:ATP-binding protein [Vicinamibacterales bacterium]